MLTIKTYRDGDRLVVIFEGLSDIPSEDDMIRSYLSNITGATVESLAPVEAKSVPVDATKVDIPEPVFVSGRYKGMTVDEAFSKGKGEAFLYVTEIASEDANTHSLDESMRSSINKSVTKYLGNFKDCDAAGYSKKLTIKQIKAFYTQYRYVTPEWIRKLVFTGENELVTDEVALRNGIEAAINHFQSLSA